MSVEQQPTPYILKLVPAQTESSPTPSNSFRRSFTSHAPVCDTMKERQTIIESLKICCILDSQTAEKSFKKVSADADNNFWVNEKFGEVEIGELMTCEGLKGSVLRR